jgi:hypothetical protein
MAESNTKRYIKTLIQLPMGIAFWGTVVVLVYANVVYHNICINKQTSLDI